MKPQLKSSRAARELIKTHEPFRPEAVQRGRKWVVGYGHTATAREGVTVSREDAELLLIYDVLNAEQAVDSGVAEKLATPVRDALVSFACSIGPGAFKVSDVARLAKAGRMRESANALETWVRAEEDGRLVVSQALTRRRAAEKALFLAGLGQTEDDSASHESQARPSEARPHPAPAAVPAKAEDTKPQAAPEPKPAPAPAEAREALEAGDGDDRPRLGPLVDLEIEFEDPPADFFADEPALDSEPDTALERAIGPDPVADTAEETIEAAEPALERALGESEDAKTEPAAEAEPDIEVSEPLTTEPAEAEPVSQAAEPQAEPAPETAFDKAEQSAVVQRVMARMARDIADTMDVPARETPGDDSEPVQLGYSFLEPLNGSIEIEPDTQAEAALERTLGPQEDAKTEPAAEAAEEVREEPKAEEPAAKPQPVAVYSSVSVGPVPVRGGPVEDTPPQNRREAPAPAPGFSGEVGGVGRPLDIEDVEEIDEEELSPELVAGREARDHFTEEGDVETREPSGGRWVYAMNFAIGAGLAGFGAWDLVSHFDIYQREGFNEAGPIVLGAGLVLMIGSVWMIAARRKPSKSQADKGGDEIEHGFSGES